MTSISRRTFLRRSGAAAATTGLAAALPASPGRVSAPRKRASGHTSGVAAPTGRAASGPLIIHVPDPRTGEIHLMFGSREVVRTDHGLMAQLVRDAG